MKKALEGIKIIEVAQYAAAPMAGRLLADLGAEVVHVEHPVTGDVFRYFQSRKNDPLTAGRGVPSDVNYNWELYNINKKGITLDLSADKGRDVFLKMIEGADVFISNLRPKELKKFAIEYPTLKEKNRRLVFANLNGYGLTGPDADSPGYDIISYWSRTAIPYLMDALGYRPAFGDNLGGLMLAFGIMTALFARERTGKGQLVDTSLFATGVFQMSFDISGALVEKKEFDEFKPKGREDSMNPLVGMFPTRDARAFVLMCLVPDMYWEKVCKALDRDDLIDDSRFNSFEGRAKNRMALFPILDQEFMKKDLSAWKPIFADIPSAPIQNLLEVVNDPHARANDFYVPLDHTEYGEMEVVAHPVKYSDTPATVRHQAPEFSQHTEEVLLELGYSWEEINQLSEAKVIA